MNVKYKTSVEVERLVAWAAQECEWQLTGPQEVSYLIDAYFYLDDQLFLNEQVILRLGHIIEPGKNLPNQYRQVNVMVGHDLKLDWQSVAGAMERFIHHSLDAVDVGDMTPTEWFREFEEIHPFVDGNGRTGALIWNWLSHTYKPMDLQFPPNLWADPRREGFQL